MSNKLTRADVAAIIRLRSLGADIALDQRHEDEIYALAATGPEPIQMYPRAFQLGDRVRLRNGMDTVGKLIAIQDNQLLEKVWHVEFYPYGGATYRMWVKTEDLELVNEA